MTSAVRLENAFHRDADLHFLEWRSSLISGAPFGTHLHEGYSVAVVQAGTTLLGCRDEMHEAGPGTLVFLPPQEPHSCNPVAGDTLDYRKYYLARDWFTDFRRELAGRAGRAGKHGFRPGSVGADRAARPAIIRQDAALHAFKHFAAALDQSAAAARKLALLRAALAHMLAAPATFLCDGLRPCEREAVSRTARMIAASPEGVIRLEELARACTLTPSHLLRVFRRAKGLTPHAYQNQLRVDMAKRLLAGGTPIAQAALDAGFVDQSHLNRVFRRYVGATPRQYVLGAKG